VLALGVFTWWGAAHGGYATTRWQPAGAALIALAAIAWIALAPGRAPLARASRVALLAFTGYVALSFLSILWADAPGDALEGSERALCYLACFVVFLAVPWTPGAKTVAVTAFAAIVGVIAVVTAVRVARIDEAGRLFADGRLLSPLGYGSATAAFFTMGLLPCCMIAAQRQRSWLLRAALLGAAGACASLAVLCQSRGWLFTLPVVLVIAIVVAADRVRCALHGALVAAAVLPALHTLLEPQRVGGGRALDAATEAALLPAAHRGGGAALLVAGALAVAGALIALADRRWEAPSSVRRHTRAIGVVLAIAVVISGAGAALVATDGHPLRRAQHAWDEFTQGNTFQEAGKSHFSSLGSNRYDFWRVAADEWSQHPLAGVGQDNFGEQYLRQRRSGEEPRWVHSLPLRLLAHTGILGALLFALVLGGAAVAAFGRARTQPEARVVTGIAVLPLIVWVVHGSIDWLWEFPALSGPALGLLAMAAAPGGLAGPAPPPLRTARVARVAVGAVAAAGAVLLLATWTAQRDVNGAIRVWRADPARAFDLLRQARRLNPLSPQADLVDGLIAVQVRDRRRARRSFDRAIERAPHSWYAHFNSGLLAGLVGNRRRAQDELAEALRLIPDDELVTTALRRAKTAHPLTFDEATTELRSRVAHRHGRP
jgi:tetratricopeptide (TPR) repeat protein